MSDLATLLPSLALDTHEHLLPTLEQQGLTTADLLSLDARTIAARTRLPVLDIARLVREIGAGLRADLGFASQPATAGARVVAATSGAELVQSPWAAISTLDAQLDAVLGGGVPVGYVTEVVGESGAGKTQFLLTLLLAAQLSSPRGLGRPTIYISTEHGLPTQRLAQMLASNPDLVSAPTSEDAPAPSLARILTLHTPDLETQEHILTYQLPVAIAAHNPGLVVLDSIAANYRDAPAGAAGLAARAASLQRTGALLKDLAREHNCAVVVSNHVADRFFAQLPATRGMNSPRRPAPTSSEAVVQASSSPPSSIIGGDVPDLPPSQMTPSPAPNGQSYGLDWHPALTLDHQLRFFTGWGADHSMPEDPTAKTPALGLVWTNQIAARIAIVKEAAWGSASSHPPEVDIDSHPKQHTAPAPTQNGLVKAGMPDAGGRSPITESSAEWAPRRWRRWMRLVFAAWASETPAGCRGAEFEIWAGGVRTGG